MFIDIAKSNCGVVGVDDTGSVIVRPPDDAASDAH